MVALCSLLGADSPVEDRLLETARLIDFGQDTFSDKFPNGWYTDHDTLIISLVLPTINITSTDRLEFGQISFTLSDTGIGKSLDFTITDRHSRKDERVFDDEFQNMG
jgi:hypothetical protein